MKENSFTCKICKKKLTEREYNGMIQKELGHLNLKVFGYRTCYGIIKKDK